MELGGLILRNHKFRQVSVVNPKLTGNERDVSDAKLAFLSVEMKCKHLIVFEIRQSRNKTTIPVNTLNL
jgi:hypothetical protein